MHQLEFVPELELYLLWPFCSFLVLFPIRLLASLATVLFGAAPAACLDSDIASDTSRSCLLLLSK